MPSIETSPFVFEGPVPPGSLAGRDAELAALRDRAAHGRFCLLHGPRRYGKTSIIGQIAADAAEDRSLVVLTVDLLGVLSLDEISRRLAVAFQRATRVPVRDAMVRLLAGVADAAVRAAGRRAGIDLGAGIIRPADHPPAATLEALLDVPWELADRLDTRVLVVLDEFQAIADVDRADAVLRSRIQHQRERVSYLFSGSEQSVLSALFAERAAPLYGQAERFELGPLPSDDAAGYVADRFEATGRRAAKGLIPLVAAAAGHPQRLNLLAHFLWEQVREGAAATTEDWQVAFDLALRHGQPEFDAVWASLSANQRKALRLASWGEPHSGAAAGRLGLAGGAATSARNALVDVGIARRNGDLIDPLLGEWVCRSADAP